MEKQRIRYIFSGDVQEVGFRSAAFQTVRQLGIAGWVKNVFDGTEIFLHFFGFYAILES